MDVVDDGRVVGPVLGIILLTGLVALAIMLVVRVIKANELEWTVPRDGAAL